MWQTAKNLKKTVKYTPPLKVSNITYISDSEKAKALAQQFATVSQFN